MNRVFEYKVVDFYNNHPAITSDFVDEVLGFFGGGHTPAIRSHLMNLEQIVTDGS